MPPVKQRIILFCPYAALRVKMPPEAPAMVQETSDLKVLQGQDLLRPHWGSELHILNVPLFRRLQTLGQ